MNIYRKIIPLVFAALIPVTGCKKGETKLVIGITGVYVGTSHASFVSYISDGENTYEYDTFRVEQVVNNLLCVKGKHFIDSTGNLQFYYCDTLLYYYHNDFATSAATAMWFVPAADSFYFHYRYKYGGSGFDGQMCRFNGRKI